MDCHLLPKPSKDKQVTSNIDDQIKVLEGFKDVILNGEVESFVVVGVNGEGQVLLATYCDDIVSSVGIIEVGKYALMNQGVE